MSLTFKVIKLFYKYTWQICVHLKIAHILKTVFIRYIIVFTIRILIFIYSSLSWFKYASTWFTKITWMFACLLLGFKTKVAYSIRNLSKETIRPTAIFISMHKYEIPLMEFLRIPHCSKGLLIKSQNEQNQIILQMKSIFI